MKLFRRAVLAAALAAGVVAPALAQTPAIRLRGTIAAHTGDTLSIATLSGTTESVALKPDTSVTWVVLTPWRCASATFRSWPLPSGYSHISSSAVRIAASAS